MYPRPLWKSVVTLALAFVNFILICTLDNGIMKSPNLREIISLVFTCLCITKSLLLCSLSEGIFNEVKNVLCPVLFRFVLEQTRTHRNLAQFIAYS